SVFFDAETRRMDGERAEEASQNLRAQRQRRYRERARSSSKWNVVKSLVSAFFSVSPRLRVEKDFLAAYCRPSSSRSIDRRGATPVRRPKRRALYLTVNSVTAVPLWPGGSDWANSVGVNHAGFSYGRRFCRSGMG